MDQIINNQDTAKTGHGPFTLQAAVPKGDVSALPLRGDLAHIGLAGRFFVPHYAVPQPRMVMPGGAVLRAVMDPLAPELCTLMEGDSFEVLDIIGDWAWGCLSLEGPSGYVHVSHLEVVS